MIKTVITHYIIEECINTITRTLKSLLNNPEYDFKVNICMGYDLEPIAIIYEADGRGIYHQKYKIQMFDKELTIGRSKLSKEMLHEFESNIMKEVYIKPFIPTCEEDMKYNLQILIGYMGLFTHFTKVKVLMIFD